MVSLECSSWCVADKYTLHRLRVGVAEGSEEVPVADCFPLEYNLDYLNGGWSHLTPLHDVCVGFLLFVVIGHSCCFIITTTTITTTIIIIRALS